VGGGEAGIPPNLKSMIWGKEGKGYPSLASTHAPKRGIRKREKKGPGKVYLLHHLETKGFSDSKPHRISDLGGGDESRGKTQKGKGNERLGGPSVKHTARDKKKGGVDFLVFVPSVLKKRGPREGEGKGAKRSNSNSFPFLLCQKDDPLPATPAAISFPK